MTSADAIEIAAKRRCLERVLALRQEIAAWELRVLQAILDDYQPEGEDR